VSVDAMTAKPLALHKSQPGDISMPSPTSCFASLALLIALSISSTALASAKDQPLETGTDPSKLINRVEINPVYLDTPGPGSLFTTNFKLDVPLTKTFALALEAPVSYASGYPAPLEDQFGLGDVFLRGRNVFSFEKSSLIVGAEFGLDTSTDPLLGTGKWQLNPSLAYVHYLSNELLLVGAVKQRIGFLGDSGRDDLNSTELRFIGIYIHPQGRWLQADYQPKIDWNNGSRVSHLLEFEAGTMLSASTGLSLRAGVGLGENRDRDWSVGLGFRFLF
jgi:hypothetical protein